MITDKIKRRAFEAAAPFFYDSEGDHFDAVLVALEAVAPMIRAQGMREAALICLKAEYPDVAIEARAQELDPK